MEEAQAEWGYCNPPPSNMPPSAMAQYAAQSVPIVRQYAQVRRIYGDRDTRVSLDTLNVLIRRLSRLPGSRTIVLASPGFYLTIDHRGLESDLLDKAIHANVTISSLDARGVYAIIPGGDAETPRGNSSGA